MGYVVENLKSLNSNVLKWEGERKKEFELSDIEDRITNVYYENSLGFFLEEDNRLLGDLEERKFKLLSIEEET